MELGKTGKPKGKPRGRAFPKGWKGGPGRPPGIRPDIRVWQRKNRDEFYPQLTKMFREMKPAQVQKLAETGVCEIIFIGVIIRECLKGNVFYVQLLMDWLYGPLAKLIEVSIDPENSYHQMTPDEKKTFLSDPANIKKLNELQTEIRKIKE
jgi:hypothetical protein